VSVDINSHFDREFWGLRFIGPVLTAPPPLPALEQLASLTSPPPPPAAIPHGPCVWLRYTNPSQPLLHPSRTRSYHSPSPSDLRSHIAAHLTYHQGVVCGSVSVIRAAALWFSCNFTDGSAHGASTSYHGSESSVACSSSWSSGCGSLSLFHDNSSIYRCEAFTDGCRHGTSTERRRDGTLRYTQEYAQVIPHHLHCHHARPPPPLPSHCLQGLRHGPRVCFADDGRTPLQTSGFSHGSGTLWLFRDRSPPPPPSLSSARLFTPPPPPPSDAASTHAAGSSAACARQVKSGDV